VQAGITGINGKANVFEDCVIYDIAANNASAPTMTISANAVDTEIRGGALTYQLYSDSGTDTRIRDYTKGLLNPKIVYDKEMAIVAGSTPGNMITFKTNKTMDFNSRLCFNMFYDWGDPSVAFGDLFKVYDSDYSHVYKFGPGNLTADRILRLPDMSADGQFLVNNASQTISNKIFDVGGTSGDGFKIKDTGGDHYFKIAVEGDLAADRACYLPIMAGNDFFTMANTVQTITQKTADVKSNNFVGVAQNPVYKRWGAYQPITATSGTTAAVVGKLEGILANHVPNGPGTNTNTWDSTEGLLINLVTTTTINQNAGLVSPTAGLGVFRRERAAKMVYRGKLDAVASNVSRLYFGVSSNAAPNISDTIANGDSLVLVGYKAAATNFEIYHNDGTGAHATTTVSGTIAKNTNFHTIEIEWTAGGNVVITFDGTSQTISTDLPATTTNLYFHLLAQNATAAIRTHSIVGVWVESD